jgi:hypothetical protein
VSERIEQSSMGDGTSSPMIKTRLNEWHKPVADSGSGESSPAGVATWYLMVSC